MRKKIVNIMAFTAISCMMCTNVFATAHQHITPTQQAPAVAPTTPATEQQITPTQQLPATPPATPASEQHITPIQQAPGTTPRPNGTAPAAPRPNGVTPTTPGTTPATTPRPNGTPTSNGVTPAAPGTTPATTPRPNGTPVPSGVTPATPGTAPATTPRPNGVTPTTPGTTPRPNGVAPTTPGGVTPATPGTHSRQQRNLEDSPKQRESQPFVLDNFKVIETTLKSFGVDSRELANYIKQGKKLEDVLKEEKIPIRKFKKEVMSEYFKVVDQGVANKQLTQQQAKQLKKAIKDTVKNWLPKK